MNFEKELLNIFGEDNFKMNVPLKDYTTFRIGGPAKYMVSPACRDCLKRGIDLCKEENVPYVIIGNGSNILVADEGFDGVVFRLCGNMSEVSLEETSEELVVNAGAGIMLSKLALMVSKTGYTGWEFAAGIPGTLGGGVLMNAGAYGGEIKDVIISAEVLTKEGEFIILNKEDLYLSYRHSAIMESGGIVVSVLLKALKGDKAAISARIEELNNKRREKQPLEFPSAGSTFKRPEGCFAGKLIEDAGLKGYKVGGAQVSEKHAGFVINTGNASAADVKQLIDYVQDKVFKEFGIHMEPEVKMIGFR